MTLPAMPPRIPNEGVVFCPCADTPDALPCVVRRHFWIAVYTLAKLPHDLLQEATKHLKGERRKQLRLGVQHVKGALL